MKTRTAPRSAAPIDIAPLSTAPIETAPLSTVVLHTLLRRVVIFGVALSLSLGLSLAAPRLARAHWSDLLPSADGKKSSTKASIKPSSQISAPAKRTVKKAGLFQGETKKPSTATSRMIDSVTSGPTKVMKNSMSALLPGKKTTATKARTVPRKMVSNQKPPSMLGRLFTPKKQEPLTVTEWMAQPRPKP